jgi:uncharacterized membrane protein
MTGFPWPTWLSWLMLLTVVATLFIVWMLIGQLGAMRGALAQMTGGRPRSRKELEEWYVAGKVNREMYDRWLDRVK